jgi:hypothetical protein
LVSVPFPDLKPEPAPTLVKFIKIFSVCINLYDLPQSEGSALSKSILTLTQLGFVDKKKQSTGRGLDLVVGSEKLEIWFEIKGK